MKFLVISALALFLAFASAGSSAAQETEIRVVDQVVAQVNDGVITLSRVNREIKNLIEQEVVQGKNREESQKVINEKRGELIANMINEELVMQRAKELKLDAEIEAAVNRQALEVMQNANIKTLDALYKEMEKQGVNPEEIRERWRRGTQEMWFSRKYSDGLIGIRPLRPSKLITIRIKLDSRSPRRYRYPKCS